MTTQLERLTEALNHFRFHRYTAVAKAARDPLLGPGPKESLSLIEAMLNYARGTTGGAADDAIEAKVIAMWQRIVSELKASGELPASWSPWDPKSVGHGDGNKHLNSGGFNKRTVVDKHGNVDEGFSKAWDVASDAVRAVLEKAVLRPSGIGLFKQSKDSTPISAGVNIDIGDAHPPTPLRKGAAGESLAENLARHGFKAAN